MAHILIAEDERDIRELIAFTLQFAGHRISEAPNGEVAVQLAQELRPDLIMTDVRMPKMTGYEVCRALKQSEATASIPVIILSAKGQDEEIEAGKEAGAVAYILKPFAPDELTRQVNQILQKLGVS